MSNRQPSTPPPLKDESANPFFTTPQISKTVPSLQVEKHNTPTINECQHKRVSSTGSTRSSRGAKMLHPPHPHMMGSSNSSHHQNSSVLFTPQTPYLNNDNDEYPATLLPMSPQTTTKKPYQFQFQTQGQNSNHHSMQGSMGGSITRGYNPLRTPEATPKTLGRKRNGSDVLYNNAKQYGNDLCSRTNSVDSNTERRGMLLEFRRSVKIQVSPEKKGIEEVELSDNDVLNRGQQSYLPSVVGKSCLVGKFKHAEDEDFEMADDFDDAREKALMNYTSSDNEESDEDVVKRRMSMLRSKINNTIELENSKQELIAPSTPPMQIMDDEYIKTKFGIEKCAFPDLLDLDDSKEKLSEARTLKNPFVISRSSSPERISKPVHKSKASSARFENEMELVYHATGDKFFVRLSEDSRRIKPKKLDFSSVLEEERREQELLLKTPQNNNRMSIKGLLNSYDAEENMDAGADADIEDIGGINDPGVSYEKIHNPFKGKIQESIRNVPEFKGMEELKEIEYINQTTGDRVRERMDEDQLRVKPKKLNFDGC